MPRLAQRLLYILADRYFKPVQAYLHCPAEWLEAADDIEVDALWPAA